MDLHNNNFIRKDTAHFADNLTEVASGKKTISGAALLPPTSIKQLRQSSRLKELTEDQMKSMTAGEIVNRKISMTNAQLLEGQWKTLVERVKQSGSLESPIAHLLLVFQDLILPAAVENTVSAENMIKRVGKWQSSYEHIQQACAAASYNIPELIFWDLAGDLHRSHEQMSLTGPAGGLQSVMPVTAADVGTALVSGHSPTMLKVFIAGGSMREEMKDDEKEIVMLEEDDDSGAVVIRTGQDSKITPQSLLNKAIAHPVYSMLAVYD
ncbi:hypothetical protein PWT90_09703 [Aphanocladium album]|nr:hypothetical protein PWT90_09703 [Aphanocladium album]